MEIRNGPNVYEVGERVANAPAYRLFRCEQKNSGRQCLLQIAVSVEENGKLDRVAYILRQLKKTADELEADYAKIKKDHKKELNYDLGFPELVDSFIFREQGRINILAFRSVPEISRMIPLDNITTKDRLRINLRSSGWIMGKTLKMLDLAHSMGIAVNDMSGRNILIEKDNHYVVIFDWFNAELFTDTTPQPQVLIQDIKNAARSVITVLGGDFSRSYIPDDKDEPFQKYVDDRTEQARKKGQTDIDPERYREEAFRQYCGFLFRLARGEERHAYKAHKAFYELVDSFWPREYHPFSTKPLD